MDAGESLDDADIFSSRLSTDCGSVTVLVMVTLLSLGRDLELYAKEKDN